MKTLYTLLFCLLSSIVLSQPSFSWARKIGGASGDQSYALAVDASGNVYTTGFFTGTVDFDPGAGTFNLSAFGGSLDGDVFVSKLDAAGNFVWAKQLGGTTGDYGKYIAVDGSGNVYITGAFTGTGDFDPGPSTFNLIHTGGICDVFVCKLDPSGNFLWARNIVDGGDLDESNGMTLDASGNVYTIGTFESIADFDPGAATFTMTSAGSLDVFISKLDASGNFVWAKKIGGINADNGSSIALDGSGNVYTTGYFQSTVDFDPGAGTSNLTSFGSGDIFVSKLDASGNFVWAKKMGGTNSDYGNGIKADALGNVFITGEFLGTADFNPGPATFNFNAAAFGDVFITKLTAAGNFVWAKQIGGTSGEGGFGLMLDASANLYVSGYLNGTADFNPGAGTFNLSAVGGADAFVTEFDSTGNFIWAVAFGGSSQDGAQMLTVDPSGSIYTTGAFSTTVDFNPGAGTSNLTSSGSIDVYIHKMLACSSSPAQPSSVSGATSVCSGTTSTYSIPSVIGATSYTWTMPSGWTGTSTTNSITATAGATAGNITVTATNACGTSAAQTLAVTVSSTPSTPSSITGNATVCNGSSQNYSVTNDVIATSYTWSLPSGWSGTSTSNSITATASATAGNITVTATNACGTSAVQTLLVSTADVPVTPGSISGTATLCSGISQTYSVAAVSGATSYTWTLPLGWSGTSTSNSITATAGATAGNITVTASNACGTSAVQTLPVTVNTVPAQPSAVNGDNSVCDGSSQNYSVTNDVTATSYTWNLPSGWSGNSTGNSITATAGATAGSITVTANNSCGSSASQTFNVTVNPLPTVTLSLNVSSVCMDNAVFALNGGLPSGGTFSGTGVTAGNFNAATAGVANHTITYSFTDGNGCTNTSTDQIAVNNCTGISNLESQISNFSIYPNPFTNEITINGNFNGTTQVTLVNSVGEIVSSAQLTSNHKLQTSNLPAGIYFIQVKNNDFIQIKKVIKQ